MPVWLQHQGLGFKGGTPICGDAFRRFLEVCWPDTDAFTLSSHAVLYNDSCALKKALQPWLVSTVTTDVWFGYGPGSSELRVYRYRVAPEAMEALLSCCYDILFRKAPPGRRANRTRLFRGALEDLCLFSKGTLFFGSISHEGECFWYPLNEEMAQFAAYSGCWSPCQWRDWRSRLELRSYDWNSCCGPEE